MTVNCLCGGVARVNKCGEYTYDGRALIEEWYSIECNCGLCMGTNSRIYKSGDEAKSAWLNLAKKIEVRLSLNKELKNEH